MHGVGLSVVNALSEKMEIEVYKDGKIHRQLYARGDPKTELTVEGTTDKHGTKVTFKADSTIFQVNEFDYELIRDRIMELAFLNKGIKIILTDTREGKEKNEVFHFEGGVAEFVEYLNQARVKLHPPIYSSKRAESVEVEFALQYTDAYSESIYSFVNNIKTVEGGTHLAGLKTALTRAINDYLRSNKIIKDERKISGDDVLEGVTIVLSAKIPEPQFEGQTKTKLGNSEVKGIVDSIAYEALKTYFEENPDASKKISLKIVSSMEAREAAQKARELIRRKNVLESSVLPGKLADCIEEDPTKAEVFLVEGDSAGGSSKGARDRKFQAILPLRGKILNVEKAPINKIFASEEIRNVILALGAGFKEDFNMAKLRYHKIVIMTDADIDGAHIRTLLLTLFYRYFKEVVEKGYIYIATPPLYRYKKGKTEQYVYSDEELQKLFATNGEGEIQRYKGLGEMNPDQLWETTMDPERRTLKKVTVDDAMGADKLFTVLMGEEVEPRRAFIEAYAKEVKNLDI